MAVKQASENVKSHNVFGQARSRSKMFRAGLYARVSTNDQQTLPMQSRAMRDYAARRGWTMALHVREVGSSAGKREAREKLLAAARRRDIDVVLVWRLDRWGRSVTDLLTTLQEREHLGVGSFLWDSRWIGACSRSPLRNSEGGYELAETSRMNSSKHSFRTNSIMR